MPLVAPFEPNEVMAFLLVLIAAAITAAVRAHPANTARTRTWWNRFLALTGLLLVAELATNIEQPFAEGTMPRTVLNLVEHLALLSAALWALNMAVRALVETHQRTAVTEEVKGDGGDHSGD